MTARWEVETMSVQMKMIMLREVYESFETSYEGDELDSKIVALEAIITQIDLQWSGLGRVTWDLFEELDEPLRVRQIAAQLVFRAVLSEDWSWADVHNPKDPRGIAVAAILIASELKGGLVPFITKSFLAERAGITRETARQRENELKEFLTSEERETIQKFKRVLAGGRE